MGPHKKSSIKLEDEKLSLQEYDAKFGRLKHIKMNKIREETGNVSLFLERVRQIDSLRESLTAKGGEKLSRFADLASASREMVIDKEKGKSRGRVTKTTPVTLSPHLKRLKQDKRTCDESKEDVEGFWDTAMSVIKKNNARKAAREAEKVANSSGNFLAQKKLLVSKWQWIAYFTEDPSELPDVEGQYVFWSLQSDLETRKEVSRGQIYDHTQFERGI